MAAQLDRDDHEAVLSAAVRAAGGAPADGGYYVLCTACHWSGCDACAPDKGGVRVRVRGVKGDVTLILRSRAPKRGGKKAKVGMVAARLRNAGGSADDPDTPAYWVGRGRSTKDKCPKCTVANMVCGVPWSVKRSQTYGGEPCDYWPTHPVTGEPMPKMANPGKGCKGPRKKVV